MNDHAKKIRNNLVKLVEFSGLNQHEVDIDSELPKWPHKYLEEFVDALPILDEEKLIYILKGIFEKNLIAKLMRSYELKIDTGDKFSDYNRRIFERMDYLCINVDKWVNSKVHKKVHIKDSDGMLHDIVIGPIHDACNARDHLLLGNPHSTKDFCTVIRASNIDGRSHPDVHLDYLLDGAIRSINIFSKTLNDSIGYVPLVASEDENNKTFLGMSFMVFVDKFKDNPELVSNVLSFLNKDPDYAKIIGFNSVELNYCCDLRNVDSLVEKNLIDILDLVKTRTRELEKKGKISCTSHEKEISRELNDYKFKIEDLLKNEIYTKKNKRNIFLKKIGMNDIGNYETDWNGATYIDLWGIDNPVYGSTLSSVECSKGYNYDSILNFCNSLKKLKKISYN